MAQKNLTIKNFQLGVSLHTVLLSLLIFSFCFVLLKTNLYATLLIIGFLIILQIFTIIRYVTKTNRLLTRFFEAIKYSDFSQSFSPSGLGKVFIPLEQAVADVIQAFKKTRAEKEEHYRYLQTVIEHINIGVLAYNPSGDIRLINRATKRLLAITQLKNIKNLTIEKPDRLLKMKVGDKVSLKINHNQLITSATVVKMKGEPITLLSIQNIQSELEEKEMEAWQNLIRVLTHEIMNSITPISSLASTASELLQDNEIEAMSTETFEDIKSAVHTIEKRSDGLMRFVNSYRSLTHLPKAKFKNFPVKDLLHHVHQLLENDLSCVKINCRTEVIPEHLELRADYDLLEQVLINLFLNAIHAVKEQNKPEITVRAFINIQGHIEIDVIDNGAGISKEIRESIFIPFFSTKKDGSGIGLSLCRQIMRLHKGTISVQSEPGIKTVFTLVF
jgi:two-component system nitrogen regulation sensor histidine kinase NtrY